MLIEGCGRIFLPLFWDSQTLIITAADCYFDTTNIDNGSSRKFQVYSWQEPEKSTTPVVLEGSKLEIHVPAWDG